MKRLFNHCRELIAARKWYAEQWKNYTAEPVTREERVSNARILRTINRHERKHKGHAWLSI